MNTFTEFLKLHKLIQNQGYLGPRFRKRFRRLARIHLIDMFRPNYFDDWTKQRYENCVRQYYNFLVA